MTQNDLSTELLITPSIQNELEKIRVQLSLSQIPGIQSADAVGESSGRKIDLGVLFSWATIFSQSDLEDAREAALRIAHWLLLIAEDESRAQPLAERLFDLLRNYNASHLAIAKGFLSPQSDQMKFGIFSYLQNNRDKVASEVIIGGKTIYLNRFQVDGWHALEGGGDVSISASTSAGKSFLILRWLSRYLAENPLSHVAYIVPTRALISQVGADIKMLIESLNLQGIHVCTLPGKDQIKEDSTNIFVFTQERLHALQSTIDNNLRIDLLIVDEAHKISDGARGVLLEQVIDVARSVNPQMREVYLSPLTDNPQALLKDNSGHTINSTEVTVGQTLFYLVQKRFQHQDWQVYRATNNNKQLLGDIRLDYKPNSKTKRISFIAHRIGSQSPGNLIYVNGPADAEKVAKQLYELIGEAAEETMSPKIKELIALIEKVVHKRYSLCESLARGVAFHYGNIPLIIREEIERLFTTGEIRFLVCTSTLIEGVNTSCKNIFVRGPQKGRNQKMTTMDFWNLAGRAGRWGKEFEGNIFCIDTDDQSLWLDGSPPNERKKLPIKRAFENALTDAKRIEGYLDIEQGHEIARAAPQLEYAISFLMDRYLRGVSVKSTSMQNGLDVTAAESLAVAVASLKEHIQIPAAIIRRNPGISPVLMQQLLNYFRRRTASGKAVEGLMPVEPKDKDAPTVFTAIFSRTYEHLGSGLGPKGGRSFGLAMLVVTWMRGWPLGRIIDERYKRTQQNIATVIRNVLLDIESVARFEAPKYVRCYLDILKLYLLEVDRTDLSDSIDDYSLMLEFGVSQPTQISMMALGLSRTATIILSEYIVEDSLGPTDVLRKLRILETDGLDIPKLIVRELEAVLANADVLA